MEAFQSHPLYTHAPTPRCPLHTQFKSSSWNGSVCFTAAKPTNRGGAEGALWLPLLAMAEDSHPIADAGEERLWNCWGGVEAQFHLKPSGVFICSYLWDVKNFGKNSRPYKEAVGRGQINKYIFSFSPLLRHFPLDRGAWWATVHGIAKLEMTEHTHTHTHTHTHGPILLL